MKSEYLYTIYNILIHRNDHELDEYLYTIKIINIKLEVTSFALTWFKFIHRSIKHIKYE